VGFRNQCEADFSRLFDLTPELETKLEIFEFEQACFYEHHQQKRTNGPVRRATNCQLWDKHQVPAIKQAVAAKAKGKASKAGADKPAKKELTPAQAKAKAKEQGEQLQRRIDAWRHDWLKSLVAAAIGGGKNRELMQRILLQVAVGAIDLQFERGSRLGAAVEAVADQVKLSTGNNFDIALELEQDDLLAACEAVAAAAVTTEDRNPSMPVIEHDEMERLASAAGVVVTQAWAALQDEHESKRLAGDDCDGCRFALLFELFQTSQLDELGEELGVHLGHVNGKAAKIKVLTTRDRALKLPKCIKPLAVPGKRKATRAK
jgi:hypothetical protein